MQAHMCICVSSIASDDIGEFNLPTAAISCSYLVLDFNLLSVVIVKLDDHSCIEDMAYTSVITACAREPSWHEQLILTI